MRTTVTLDTELLERANELLGPMDRSALLNAGLKALIEREASRRLARLGGSEPELFLAPRRKPVPGGSAEAGASRTRRRSPAR